MICDCVCCGCQVRHDCAPRAAKQGIRSAQGSGTVSCSMAKSPLGSPTLTKDRADGDGERAERGMAILLTAMPHFGRATTKNANRLDFSPASTAATRLRRAGERRRDTREMRNGNRAFKALLKTVPKR